MRESILSSLESFGLEDSLRLALLECSRSTTLHRLLGTKFASVDFLRNQDNPLHHDLVIIDEASMVDLPDVQIVRIAPGRNQISSCRRR